MTYQDNFQKWFYFLLNFLIIFERFSCMDEKPAKMPFYTNFEFRTAGMRGLINSWYQPY